LDIDYFDVDGVLQRVEGKGTIAAAFTGIDLTAKEMNAAVAHGTNYWLYLVAGCLAASPKVQAIQDPAGKLHTGEWSATPAVYSLKFAPSLTSLKLPAHEGELASISATDRDRDRRQDDARQITEARRTVREWKPTK
jgi:hypothetical protein